MTYIVYHIQNGIANIIEAEACEDHIHMLVEIPPKMAVSSFMGYLKGKSSLMIFEKWGNARYQYRNREFWCRGYCLWRCPHKPISCVSSSGSIRQALDRICAEYNRVIGNMELEPLIAIPVFIHDFLCIHPFNDGNGRMSRLLTTLLLYRSGFYVGKYISLEAKIAKNKDLYYAALAQAQIGWHEGTEDVVPFIKYLLGTILAAYKDFEDRMALVKIKLPALEMVRRASKNRIGRFNKQDIRELCPTLSDSSIEGALRKLIAAGELKKEGRGKNTCYFRLN